MYTNVFDRRVFLGLTAGVFAASWAQAQSEKPVRIGMVGVGSRGTSLLRILLDLPGVQVPAICDINEANLRRSQEIVEQTGSRRPEGYSRGDEDFRRMVTRDDLDVILTATPWEWHTPVCLAAMTAGKYAATEVPAAITLEECWDLVNTSEQTGMPCMMLENVNFYRNVMMILNMIRQDAFGEVSHCEGGYQHYLGHFTQDGEPSWRGMHSVKRNANVYPTHPIGPIAWWTNINRGDRFTHLVSMSSASRGLNAQAARRFGPDSPAAKRTYAMGDVNSSLIRTENGVSIVLRHDVQLPRPYDLGFRVQGTKGIYSGTLEKIYIIQGDDRQRTGHQWQEMEPYYHKYDHPLWKSLGHVAVNYSHRGGDYLELVLLVAAVRNRTQTPIDVYDSVTWSAITPLSEQSVASNSAPVDFPDFTRGKWKTTKPVDIKSGV